MARPLGICLTAALTTLCGIVHGQTVINGSSFALKSSGTTSGTTGTLSQNGYFGTYVTLTAPGTISFTANASGVASQGINPHMTISVADYSQSFSVGSSSNAYTYSTPTLKAGTYFVRTQLDNDQTQLVNGLAVTPTTSLTLANLTVSANATVTNSNTNALALSAANTYIDNFRKGSATVKLQYATPGDSVHVQLANGAFKMGTAISGGYSTTDNQLLANPAVGSDTYKFQQFINGRFNAIEPSNAGKWERNETVSVSNNTVTNTPSSSAGIVDQMMAYAAAHGMDARQHNVIWGAQQPAQVVTWLKNPTAQNVAYLKQAITNRIASYIQGTNSIDQHVRAADFQQLDVLNEALLTGNYYSVLGGYNGIADVYKAAQDAVAAKGLSTKLYTNEYNVLQNAPTTVTPSATYGSGATATYGDVYANFYRKEVEGINNAGISHSGASGDVVTGIGVQYYPSDSSNKGPTYIQAAMQNLSVTGLPISLTEFGGNLSLRDDNVTGGQAPQLVDDTIRMMMGTPNVNLMNYWGWYDDGSAATNPYGGGTVMVNKGVYNADGSLNLTATGVRFEYLFGRGLDPSAPGANPDGSNPDPLTTDLTEIVNADGTINFTGFYGDYLITIDGKQYNLTLSKDGVNTFTLVVPEPTLLGLMSLTPLLLRRRR